jgi:hypothetical protein
MKKGGPKPKETVQSAEEIPVERLGLRVEG